VLFLELLSLPPPPKKVKGWTLRQVTALSTSISLSSYPPSSGIGVETPSVTSNTQPQSVSQSAAPTQQPVIPGTGGLPGWPPLRVSYLLPSNTIVRDKNPVVGWWDSDSKTWRTEGITDVDYDAPTKTVTFKTMHVTALAIIQV
jgi:cancer susceptibility candidate protein 1